MKKLLVYSTNKPFTSNIMRDFSAGVNSSHTGWGSDFCQLDSYLETGLPRGYDMVAVLGILRGTGLIIQDCIKNGINYCYLDHAYFDPGYTKNYWLRILLNSHSAISNLNTDPTKWNQHFQHLEQEISPWRRQSQFSQKKILVCPPTNATMWYFNIPNWEKDMIDQLLSYGINQSDILIRRKPNEAVVDKQGNYLGVVKPARNTPSLDYDLEKSALVITYNSIVSLTATMKSIPVITDANNACYSVSRSLENLRDFGMYSDEIQLEPRSRRRLFYMLANNQYKKDEIMSGSAWREIHEQYLKI